MPGKEIQTGTDRIDRIKTEMNCIGFKSSSLLSVPV
jgi:hypothetical protein